MPLLAIDMLCSDSNSSWQLEDIGIRADWIGGSPKKSWKSILSLMIMLAVELDDERRSNAIQKKQKNKTQRNAMQNRSTFRHHERGVALGMPYLLSITSC
jgi:hypothetical protein